MTKTIIEKEVTEVKTIDKILPSYEELKWVMLSGSPEAREISTRKFYFSYLHVKKEIKKILEACPFSEEAFEDALIEKGYGYDEEIPYLNISFKNFARTFKYKHTSDKYSNFSFKDTYLLTGSEKAEAIKANEAEVLTTWDKAADFGISIADYVKEYLKFYESMMCSKCEEEYFENMEEKQKDFEYYNSLISKVLPPYKDLKEKLLSWVPNPPMKQILKFHSNYKMVWRELYNFLKTATKEQLEKFNTISLKQETFKKHDFPEEIAYDVVFFKEGRNYLLFSYKTLEEIETCAFYSMREANKEEMSFSETYAVEIFRDNDEKTVFEKVKEFLEETTNFKIEKKEIYEESVPAECASDEEIEEFSFDKIVGSSTPEKIESEFINVKSGTASIYFNTDNATFSFTTDVLTAIKLMQKIKCGKH